MGTPTTIPLAIRQLRAGAAKSRLPQQARPMRRHASEQRLGHFQHYNTRQGRVLRLVQARPAGHSLVDELPKNITLKVRAPRTILGVEIGGWREVRDILLGTIVIGTLFAGIFIWAGILQAVQS